MMKTSSPRTDSWIVMDVSPLEKRFASRLFTGYPSLGKSSHQNGFSFPTVQLINKSIQSCLFDIKVASSAWPLPIVCEL